jgi:hypothetical protein
MGADSEELMKHIRIATTMVLAAALAVSAFSGVMGAQDEKSAKAQKPGRVTNNPTMETGAQLLTAKNARLMRTEDGIAISMRLITPEAGSYTYPDTVAAERQAQPEVFTGWVFIFNNPENCTSFPDTEFPCGGADFNDDVKAGAYNFSGVTNSLGQFSGGEVLLNPHTDGMVTLVGEIEVGKQQLPPVMDGTTSHPLDNPMGAEVHVAIAPHGQFDAATMPDELFSPVGSPTCECWWVATFPAQT